MFLHWQTDEWDRSSWTDTDTQFGGILPTIPSDEQELIEDLSVVHQAQAQPVIKSSHTTNVTQVSHAISRRPHYIRQTIQSIMAECKIPGLETALKAFLIQSSKGILNP